MGRPAGGRRADGRRQWRGAAPASNRGRGMPGRASGRKMSRYATAGPSQGATAEAFDDGRRHRRRRGSCSAAVAFLTLGSSGRDPSRSGSGRADGSAGGRVGRASSSPAVTRGSAPADSRCPCPNLIPGSNPAVLPASVLIADHRNNRLLIVAPNGSVTWEFPRPGDLAPGQTFLVPDDAFVTPDGRYIVATQEDDFVISTVSIAAHRIVWRYGTPGVPGSGPNQLWNPDDAMMMPDGDVMTADIKNCRVLVLRPGLGQPVKIFGRTTQACWHDPPDRLGQPKRFVPDGQWRLPGHRDQWLLGRRTDAGGPGAIRDPSARSRLPVGHQ